MQKFFTIPLIFLLIFSLCPSFSGAQEILDWQECVKEAAKNHPDLISAEENVKESEASKKITASTLYPQINSNLNASTARTDSGTGTTVSSVKDSYSYGLSGTQLIFDGTKTINNVKAASEEIKAAKENFRYTSTTVRYNLRTAFVNLLRAQENLQITEQIYNIRRENYELITLRYEAGLEHKGALLTAEANLDEAILDIKAAKRDIEVAQRQLIREMGRTQLSPIEIEGDFSVVDSVKTKPDFVALAKNNPSLQQVIAQKNSAKYGLNAAYANFSPTLNGQAGANKNSSRWAPHGDQWNLGLVLSMPIFEGGLRFAQVSQAKAILNQYIANERSTHDTVVVTLEQTWADLQDMIDDVQVQKKLLTATEERSKIAQAQYSIGVLTFDNWTIIEDNLVKAKKTYLDAQAAALYAEASWIQAKGETLEYE